MKPVIIIGIAVVFVIGLGFSLNVSAEGELIPSWIKNIAGFWADDQISDMDFLSALQFLVENNILIIPEKESIPESDSTITTNSNLISEKYQANLESYFIQGDRVLTIISISDSNGDPISVIGEIKMKIISKGGNEMFSEKKYLVIDTFSDYTNDISGETVTGFKWIFPTAKIKTTFAGSISSNLHPVMKLIVIAQDESYENEIELRHLPINEGFFGEDTGFIHNVEVNKALDLGPFFVTVEDAGQYIGINDNGLLQYYFRINFTAQFKSTSEVQYILNEVYIVDEKNNLYLTELDVSELGSVFDGDIGYVLFEKIPPETSSIKLVMDLSVIQTDLSETHYQDEVEFSLN